MGRRLSGRQSFITKGCEKFLSRKIPLWKGYPRVLPMTHHDNGEGCSDFFLHYGKEAQK